MSAISTETRFFGLDLSQLKNDIRQTWRKAPQWPPLSWLRPELQLTLVPASGEPTQVWESGAPAGDSASTKTDFWAIELPEALVLRKMLHLPAMDPQDCASAAALEAQSISPFPQEDLMWGCVELSRSTTAVRMQLVLASRAQVEPYLQTQIIARQHTLPAGKTAPAPEVWVFTPQRQPVVFQGFGEAARAQAGRAKLLRNAGGIALAIALLAAIAVTPTAQLRLRALEAIKAYEQMAAKTVDVVGKREQLMQSADKVAGLSELLAERIDDVKVLSMLTRELPDDTALQSARIQGGKVTISGMTENASALMQKLSSLDGIKDVKAPSAATRIQGANRESFTIELNLDSKTFGPTLKVEEPPVSVPVAADAAPIEAASPGPAAATPAPLNPPPVAAPAAAPSPSSPAAKAGGSPAPAQSRGPTLGGSRSGPSPGGSKPAPQPAPGGNHP